MTPGQPRPFSLLLRSLVGIAVLVFGTAGGAWLMHTSIEPDGDTAVAGITTGSIAYGPLARVRSWSLATEVPDAADQIDLAVVDPAAFGTDAVALPAAVEAAKRRSDGSSRLVVARISVATVAEPAEAAAAQTARVRPLDDGRIPVAYWSSVWHDRLYGSSSALVDRLVSAGFDGVYVADADVYVRLRKQWPGAENDMVQLVERLSARAKSMNPAFAVVLANAEELIAHPGIRNAVDALAKEDLLFGSDGVGETNPRSAVVASLHFLERAQRAGQPVLVAEHLEPGPGSADALQKIRERGFIGTIAPVTERRRAPLD